MPIRKDLLHFYRGPAWALVRSRILLRAGNCCESCGKRNGERRLKVVRGGFWFDQIVSCWRNDRGQVQRPPRGLTVYTIRCVLTIAHLNHVPGDNRDCNLRAWCQHCHLKYDVNFHFANARRNRAASVGQLWLSPDLELVRAG